MVPLLAVEVAEERPDRLLRHDVEADGGLVEEQHRRVVQQRGGQLAAHALAERQLAHRRGQERSPMSSSSTIAVERRRVVGRPAPGTRGAAGRTSRAEGRSHHSWRALAEHHADASGDRDAITARDRCRPPARRRSSARGCR